MAEPQRKAFWKWKRWVAVAICLLFLAYPASFGPIMYLIVRDWLPTEPAHSHINGIVDVLKWLDGDRAEEPISGTHVYYYYLGTFVDLAYSHDLTLLPQNED